MEFSVIADAVSAEKICSNFIPLCSFIQILCVIGASEISIIGSRPLSNISDSDFTQLMAQRNTMQDSNVLSASQKHFQPPASSGRSMNHPPSNNQTPHTQRHKIIIRSPTSCSVEELENTSEQSNNPPLATNQTKNSSNIISSEMLRMSQNSSLSSPVASVPSNTQCSSGGVATMQNKKVLLSVESATRRQRITRQKSSTETSGLGSSIECASSDNLSHYGTTCTQQIQLKGGITSTVSPSPSTTPQLQRKQTDLPSMGMDPANTSVKFSVSENKETEIRTKRHQEQPPHFIKENYPPENSSLPSVSAEGFPRNTNHTGKTVKVISTPPRHAHQQFTTSKRPLYQTQHSQSQLETIESGESSNNGHASTSASVVEMNKLLATCSSSSTKAAFIKNVSSNQRSLEKEVEKVSVRTNPQEAIESHSNETKALFNWAKWSQERRAGLFKRQGMDGFPYGICGSQDEECHFGQQTVSTPIMRARKESMHFSNIHFGVQSATALPLSVSGVATVEGQAFSNFTENLPTAGPNFNLENCGFSNCQPPSELASRRFSQAVSRSGRQGASNTMNQYVRLTPEQLHQLHCYWEHDTFVRSRSWALCSTLISSAMTLYAFFSQFWIFMGDDHHPNHMGLWDMCLPHNNNVCETIPNLDSNGLQKLVIFLMAFGSVFVLFGTGLAIAAIFIKTLARKLYFHHSAGEVFFVSGIVSSAGLALYPMSIRQAIPTNESYHFGHSYWLGWTSCALEFIGSFCMLLDEIIKETAGPLSSRGMSWILKVCCLPCSSVPDNDDSFIRVSSSHSNAQLQHQRTNQQRSGNTPRASAMNKRSLSRATSGSTATLTERRQVANKQESANAIATTV